jgi:hypothetical protein
MLHMIGQLCPGVQLLIITIPLFQDLKLLMLDLSPFI